MKKLSIEEKARRYDEAVERLRNAFYDNNSRMYEEYRNAALKIIEPIFPELVETEDDRIRKELMAMLSDAANNIEHIYYASDCKRWLAWLEKQEIKEHDVCDTCDEKASCVNPCPTKLIEQKPIDKVESKFKVGDEIKTKNEESFTITRIDRWGYWSEDLFICDFDDADKWELVEQKPIEEVNGEDYGIDGLWHAQRILEKTLGDVEGYQSDDGILDHKAAITAVKKLYNQRHTEWSEEDKRIKDNCISFLGFNKEDSPQAKCIDECINWLKSIRPKSQWKPSKEQIKTLGKWLDDTRYKGDCRYVWPIFDSLYEQLKKLREE